MSWTKVVEKIKKHISCYVTLFRKSYRLCYNGEKSHLQPDRPRRMRFATWITKATNTHSIYNTYRCSTVTEVTRMCLSVMLYLHWLFCCGVGFYVLL